VLAVVLRCFEIEPIQAKNESVLVDSTGFEMSRKPELIWVILECGYPGTVGR
jgi:hypothetical protein